MEDYLWNYESTICEGLVSLSYDWLSPKTKMDLFIPFEVEARISTSKMPIFADTTRGSWSSTT